MTNWRSRLSAIGLRGRLLAGVSVLMALVLAMALLALWQGQRLGEQLERIVAQHQRRAELAHGLLAALLDMQVQQRTMIVLTDPEDLQDARRRVDASVARYADVERSLAATLDVADVRLAPMREALQRAQQLREEAAPVIESALVAAQKGSGADAAISVLLTAEAAQQRWAEQVRDIVAQGVRVNEAEARLLGEQLRQARQAVLVLAVVALALAALMAAALLRSILAPLRLAMQMAERIAAGDLHATTPPLRSDEFGRLLAAIDTMRQALRTTVSELRESAQAVDVASREIAAGSMALSQRTEQAAAQLQETAGTLRGLTEAIVGSAKSAQSASALAQSSVGEAAQGGAAVAQMERGMENIAQAAQRITEIVSSIHEIAFQTNILALNASVEAARAGEAGRGFSVVADAVRELAQRSATAAGEIRALSAETSTSVEQGQRSAATTGSAVQALVQATDQVADTVRDVAAAAALQSEQLRRIDKGVAELDRRTQHDAALVEQLSASAAALQARAADLAASVSHFRLDDQPAPGN